MIVTEVAHGLYRFDLVWPQGTGVEIMLTLTDPDGEEESDVINWMADQDYSLRDALMGIVSAVDDLVHWRAIVSGQNISIGPASADYVGNVEVSVYAQ